jgi:hypothetical protein
MKREYEYAVTIWVDKDLHTAWQAVIPRRDLTQRLRRSMLTHIASVERERAKATTTKGATNESE